MRVLFAVAAVAAFSMMASVPFAQTRSPPSPNHGAAIPAVHQSLTVRAVPVNPAQTENEPHVLFHIGSMPVHVWAPVQASYNAHMNRNSAEKPMWEANAF